MSVGLVIVNVSFMQAIAAEATMPTPPPSLFPSTQHAPQPTLPTNADAPKVKPKSVTPTIKHGIIQPSAKPRALAEDTDTPPVPLAPGSRVVASLDPKEDFIILGKEEAPPIEPAKPAMEAAADIAGGLGIMEPTRLTLQKAPVTVSPGIVPVTPAKAAVQLAGPNIGAEPVLHHPKPKTAAPKASVALALNAKMKSTIHTLTPPPKPLVAVKSVAFVKPVKPVKLVKLVKPAKPVKSVKVAAFTPVPQPFKLVKPMKSVKPAKVLAVQARKAPKKTVSASLKPKKGFVPVVHQFASYHPPKFKKVLASHPVKLTKTHLVVKAKTPAKIAVFKPVIKPYAPSHHATRNTKFKPVIKPYALS